MIVVTGYDGRLGRALISLGCIPLRCNVIKIDEIENAMDTLRVSETDTLIHCASITDVDGCETDLYKLSYQVNAIGTGNIREYFPGRMIYISTDFVFDGKAGAYSETDYPNPINRYGMTKLRGEEIMQEYAFPRDVIVRTTVLFGGNKADFVTAVLKRLKMGKPFEIPSYLFGNATYVYYLAEALVKLCEVNLPRNCHILNVAGTDILSRYELAVMIANVFGHNPELVIPSTRSFGDAVRPHKAGLKTTLAKKLRLPLYTALEGLEAMKIKMENK